MKSPVPFELDCHLKSGINSLSNNASFLSKLQWREMDGLKRYFKQPHKYTNALGVAAAIEDCHLPVLCGTSSSSLPGLWVGTQSGNVVNINDQLQPAGGGWQVHNNAILDICSGPGLDGYMATASGDKSIILWDTKYSSNEVVRQYNCGNGGSIRKVVPHHSAKLLAAASRSGWVSVIDTRSSDPIMTLHTNAHYTLAGKTARLSKAEKAAKPGLTAIDWITDTTLATGAGNNSEIRIWDTRYLKKDGPSGINEVEGKAARPVALFRSEDNKGVTDLHYDQTAKILYSVGHKSVSGYSCNYGSYTGMNTTLTHDLDTWLPPVLSAPVENRTFYSGSAITDGYLAVGEGADTVSIFSLPDSFASVSQGMECKKVAADASGSLVNVNGAMEIAALSWVQGTLMGCTDAGVVFRIDETNDRN